MVRSKEAPPTPKKVNCGLCFQAQCRLRRSVSVLHHFRLGETAPSDTTGAGGLLPGRPRSEAGGLADVNQAPVLGVSEPCWPHLGSQVPPFPAKPSPNTLSPGSPGPSGVQRSHPPQRSLSVQPDSSVARPGGNWGSSFPGPLPPLVGAKGSRVAHPRSRSLSNTNIQPQILCSSFYCQ